MIPTCQSLWAAHPASVLQIFLGISICQSVHVVGSLEKPELFLRMRAAKEKFLKELEKTGKLAKTTLDEYLHEKVVGLRWFELFW